jgi:murein DD-endopeptidase MepM/ murein hydrolase activator NlpD
MLGVAGPPTAVAGLGRGFQAPLPLPLEVVRGFAPPARLWEPGNRGVDLAAHTGERVYAATPGVVLYAGELAGRGVISIRDGTLRTTYEPVDPVVHAGDLVTQGELIGYVSDAVDNCGPPGTCLHWGALRSDAYIDPMGLLRAPVIRLLPISTALGGLSQLRGLLGEFGS